MYSSRLNSYLLNVIVSVIMVFAILITVILNFFTYVLLDKTTYTDAMYENEVDTIAFEEINQYFDRQYAYTGIDAEVFKSVVDRNDISVQIFSYIDSTFEYMTCKTDRLPEFNYDFTAIEESLNADYERWAEENDTVIDEEAQKNIDMTLKSVKEVINNKLDVLMLSYLNKENGISTFVHDHYPQLKTLRIASFGVVAFCILLLVIINRKKHLNNIFYWTGSSLFASSVIILAPCAYLRFTSYFDGLILKNDAIYQSLTQSMYGILDKNIACAIVLLIVSIVLFVVNMAMYKGWFRFTCDR